MHGQQQCEFTGHQPQCQVSPMLSAVATPVTAVAGALPAEVTEGRRVNRNSAPTSGHRPLCGPRQSAEALGG